MGFGILKRVLLMVIAINICFTAGCQRINEVTPVFNQIDVTSDNTSMVGGGLGPCAVSYPDITTDSSGGAYAVYQVYMSKSNLKEVYVQKISSKGSRLWGEKGILITNIGGIADVPLRIFSDNNGNAIVAWRNDQGTISLTRINSEGHILWQKDVEPFDTSQIISDGAGGLIYIAKDSILKRIDAEGNLIWARNTTAFDINKVSGKFITSDGLGGVITYALESDTGESSNIYLQRIDSSGDYCWQKDDTLLYSTDKEVGGMSISADGTEGAVVIWDENKGDVEQPNDYDLRALRIDKNGNILWQRNNKPIIVSERAGGVPPLIVGDGRGGAFTFDFSGANIICWQRISPEGDLLWPADDCNDYQTYGNSCLGYRGISDGNGGVILIRCVWEAAINRYLEAQRIGPDGNSLFTQGEIQLSDDRLVHPFYFVMAPDGNSGALIAWGSSRDLYSIEHSSVQRINAEGELIWGSSGIRLDDWNK
ncbi:MAG: hypothetical protein MUO89_07095 [Dehalococcoidia bacterium]|nr:hypothetical protein [Dehalococcoidia bacterium]